MNGLHITGDFKVIKVMEDLELMPPGIGILKAHDIINVLAYVFLLIFGIIKWV